jgi:hypothetical protein
MSHTLFFTCWIVGFIAFPYFLARQSGWPQLRSSFPATDEPAGVRFRAVSLSLNGAGYRGILYAVVAENGLYLDPFIPIFPLYHPPLLIPWSAFSPFKARGWEKLLETTITTRDGSVITFVTQPNLQREIQAMLEKEERRLAPAHDTSV